ncbi:MAG: hypothetical protein IPK02_08075 [Candidatus Accumulibacter sp.]|uniref:Uncharacterized protein n=1 Tax=Candidatus Accumulibacter affinis TaxID=2954384 RepID=A0A935W7J7_9PROT|nr:hypothetical protein [Candidatus Accumulibacter affinis]
MDSAHWLAHLLRLGILPVGTSVEGKRVVCEITMRKRNQLVGAEITAKILNIENVLSRDTGGRASRNARSSAGRKTRSINWP